MATISIEFGKESSQKTREVYLLVRQGKTRQRVKTGVRLNEQEYSPKTKKIKSIEKARIVEKLRLDLIDNMSNLTAGAMAGDPDDAHTITKKIIKKQEKKELEFFAYAEDWVSRAKIKGAKNYLTMLNTLVPALQGTQASAQKGCQGFKPGTTHEGGQLPAQKEYAGRTGPRLLHPLLLPDGHELCGHVPSQLSGKRHHQVQAYQDQRPS